MVSLTKLLLSYFHSFSHNTTTGKSICRPCKITLQDTYYFPEFRVKDKEYNILLHRKNTCNYNVEQHPVSHNAIPTISNLMYFFIIRLNFV